MEELLAWLDQVPPISVAAFAVVAAAGLAMGVAPSSLPLVSVVVGCVAGRAEAAAAPSRAQGALFSLGFVLGLATVDAAIGALFGFLGSVVIQALTGSLMLVNLGLAVLLLGMGLALLRVVRMPWPALRARPREVRSFGGAWLLGLPAAPALAGAQGDFRYDASNVDTAAHWAARATLANAVMLSGLGEPLDLSMAEMDRILKHAGYATRPPMPDMALVGTVYAAGDPRYPGTPEFGEPATLRWDSARFDRTLDPAAQAWALVKIMSPGFHLTYHEGKADRRAALLMLPQAEAQAQALAERLRNADGLFAARSPDGAFAPPKPVDQAAVLWGASNLIIAASSERDDYWHKAYRRLVDAEDYRPLAAAALAAVEMLPPEDAAARAIAIAALGRYALATESGESRDEALALARKYAEALANNQPAALEEIAFAIYGLVEAGRLLGDDAYGQAAVALFQGRLLPLWSEEHDAFVGEAGATEVVYTPECAGAVVAALNALRWYGPAEAAETAARLYPRFFEAVLVRGGLLQSSPLPLVPADYLAEEPAAHFAHPALPAPAAVGVAPVFAAEVRLADGTWSVADPTFRTGPALFLANMLVGRHEGEADAFLPDRLLADLR